jgi:hypothetical protein
VIFEHWFDGRWQLWLHMLTVADDVVEKMSGGLWTIPAPDVFQQKALGGSDDRIGMIPITRSCFMGPRK